MSRIAWVLLLLLVLPGVAANGAHRPAANHSPSVQTFAWSPVDPLRGDTVRIGLLLLAGVQVDAAHLVYCRVQEYACAPALAMNSTDGRAWYSEIPWTPENDRFFAKTTMVGLNVTLNHKNGTKETSPINDWPDRPADMPAEGGDYYYYVLPAPPPKKAPGVELVFVAAVALASAVALRRRMGP